MSGPVVIDPVRSGYSPDDRNSSLELVSQPRDVDNGGPNAVQEEGGVVAPSVEPDVRTLCRQAGSQKHMCACDCALTLGADGEPSSPASKRAWLQKFPLLNTTKGPQPLPIAAWQNLRSALTVALVSVSLSIALGIASGTTPGPGLASAVWGGAAGGVFGSSQFNIIGPAGALSGLLNGYAERWGPHCLPWISLCSAGVAFAVQQLGLIPYLLFMPTSVFEGFTVAVAIIIAFGQINNGFGLVPAHRHSDFIDNFIESMKVFGHARWESYALFLSEAVVLYALCRYVPKVPWMAVMPLSTILFGYFAPDMNWALPTLKSKYGELGPSDVFRWPDPNGWNEVEPGAFVIAVLSVSGIAVLETVISAKIAEGRTGYKFDPRKETKALAIGHLLCGCLGALPCTGVFVRTAINVDLGATHRISQLMNAIFVAFVSAVAMQAFQYVPLASIAAVLWVASIRMVPTSKLKHLWHVDRIDFCVCVLTAVICVVVDPVVGLVAGMVISLLRNAMQTYVAYNAVEKLHKTIIIRGSLSYLNYHPVETAVLDLATNESGLTLDIQNITVVDSDGASALARIAKKLSADAMVRVTAQMLVPQPEFVQQISLAWLVQQRKPPAHHSIAEPPSEP